MNSTQTPLSGQVALLEADVYKAKALLIEAQAEIDHLKRKLQLMRELIEAFEKQA